MAVPPLESALLAPVARHFAEQGYSLRAEVPVNGRFADLLALKGDDLVAVELKLTDWRGALRQAVAYQVGADRSYVALPLDTAMTVLRRRSAFEEARVGLLAVHPPDGSVRQLLPSDRSARHLPFQADGLRRLFGAPVGESR